MSPGQDGIRRLKMSVCAVVKVFGMEVCVCMRLNCTRLLQNCQYAILELHVNIFDIAISSTKSSLLSPLR